MKRRLNIAAGTIHGPKVLLLDEPTVGVDPQSRNAIFENLETLRSRGKALVYTTHYMEEAERLCDRVAIIDHGKIIASGTKEELVRKTVGARQAVLVETDGAIPAPLAARLSARGAVVDGSRVRLSVEDPADEIRTLLELFHAERVPVRDLILKAPTLEQVFLQLTGRELRE